MMNKKIFGLTLLTGSTLALAIAAGQLENLKIEDSPAAPPKQQKLVRVSSLNSIQANQEFQRNVRILQAQRQRAIELNEKIKNAASDEEKAGFQKELDAVLAKLNENNQKMVKTYGFSLTRNYTVVVEKAHVYMFVSDEEAAKYETADKRKKEQN